MLFWALQVLKPLPLVAHATLVPEAVHATGGPRKAMTQATPIVEPTVVSLNYARHTDADMFSRAFRN
jgi:hypothetical protein